MSGGRFQYLHCSCVRCRRQWKRNPVPKAVNGLSVQGYINMGIWSCRLEESWTWDSKIWSWVLGDLDRRMTVLARANSNSKWQTCPLLREGAPDQQTHNCLAIIKIWSWVPDWGSTPRQTGWLTVDHNITLTLTLTVESVENCSCEKWKAGSWGRRQFGILEEEEYLPL
jgi:hypothetical protein